MTGSAAAVARALTTAAVAELREPVDRLVASSRRHARDPYTELARWPLRVDSRGAWFFTPELSSLYGTEAWEWLDDAARHAVAFHEALNFFSLNIAGERELVQGLAARLYRPDLVELAPYLHHFLDEENKHSVYFGTFCRRYGTLYRTRQVPAGTAAGGAAGADLSAAEADLRFFAKVLVFEELVDRFNLAQARDERLHPIVRFVNHNHHVEEARHLVFGRRLVAALWRAHAPTWTDEQVSSLRRYVAQFYVTTWREYYNPDVYRDAGLDDPWEVAERAWRSDAQRARRRTFADRSVRFLLDCGLLREEPDVC